MRRLVLVLALLAVLAVTSVGCTTRYSQSISGTIPKTSGRQVESSHTGFSFLAIALSEPHSAHEQVTDLLHECEALNKVEVDYREMVVLLLFGFPKVTVKADCL